MERTERKSDWERLTAFTFTWSDNSSAGEVMVLHYNVYAATEIARSTVGRNVTLASSEPAKVGYVMSVTTDRNPL